MQTDSRKWDYRRQNPLSTNVKPWQVAAGAKAVELISQAGQGYRAQALTPRFGPTVSGS